MYVCCTVINHFLGFFPDFFNNLDSVLSWDRLLHMSRAMKKWHLDKRRRAAYATAQAGWYI